MGGAKPATTGVGDGVLNNYEQMKTASTSLLLSGVSSFFE